MPHPSSPTPGRHIVIVDSDPAAAMVTQHGLQCLLGAGVTATIAPSAGAAWLRCQREAIDLVIVDPAPHDCAAWALIKALRAHCPTIPVLILTAYDTVGLRARMQALGVWRYRAKPAMLQELKQDLCTVFEAV